MTLSELLVPDLVFPKITCSSKDELISILLDQVYSKERSPPLPQQEMMKKIKMREEIGGTLLPSGLSIPHARLPNYEGFILALGMPAEPLIHQGLQIRLMTLMISNQSGNHWYLPVLAFMTKISRDAEYFQRLSGAETYENFIKILKERDQELG